MKGPYPKALEKGSANEAAPAGLLRTGVATAAGECWGAEPNELQMFGKNPAPDMKEPHPKELEKQPVDEAAPAGVRDAMCAPQLINKTGRAMWDATPINGRQHGYDTDSRAITQCLH